MEASDSPTSSANGEECLPSSTSPPTIDGAPNMLDLVFCIDSTGSMGPFIRAAQENTCQIVEALMASEKCDIRFGLVAYRDHPPQDLTFITRKFEFTSSCSTMRTNVNTLEKFVRPREELPASLYNSFKQLGVGGSRIRLYEAVHYAVEMVSAGFHEASGGGDEPESICCGLYDVLHMDWRKEATKVVILIADAPPHGIYAFGDGFPNGCPDGRDPITIGHEMAEQGICVYTVGCGLLDRHRYAHAFMVGLAEMTHGQAVTLSSAQQLVDVILGGAQEELVLERLMPLMEREQAAVVREIGDRRRSFGAAPVVSEESEEFQAYQQEVQSAVHQRMACFGVQTQQLSHNSKISAPDASTMACSRSLGEWRTTAQPTPAAPSGLARGAFGLGLACPARSAGLFGSLTVGKCRPLDAHEPGGGIGGGRGRGRGRGRGEMTTYGMKAGLFGASDGGRGSDSRDPEGHAVRARKRAAEGADRSKSVGFSFGTAAEGADRSKSVGFSFGTAAEGADRSKSVGFSFGTSAEGADRSESRGFAFGTAAEGGGRSEGRGFAFGTAAEGGDRSEGRGFAFGTAARAPNGGTRTSGDSSRRWSEGATKVTTRTATISMQQVSRMMAKVQSRSRTKDDVGV